MIKKLLYFLLTVTFALEAYAQSAGFNTTYIVLNVNGADAYYDLQAVTGNADFNNTYLGSYHEGSGAIIFRGGEHNVYKCNGCDLQSTRLYYRIYVTGQTPGSFVSNTIPYFSGFDNGCSGQDQQWRKTDYSVDLLAGLEPGDYTIEAYSDATITCTGGVAYAGNGGLNYKATFTVTRNTWTGNASSNWEDQFNWSWGVVPTTTDNAAIGAGPNNPDINGATPYVNKLFVLAGGYMNIPSQGTLRVQDAISVAPGGSLVVQDGGSLIQYNDADNVGTVTVHKNSNPLYKLDYTIWSSPVTGQMLQDFSPLTLPNRFYTYGVVNNEENYISTSSAGTFQPGVGYLIRMPDHLEADHPDYDGYELGYTGAPGAVPYVHEGVFEGGLINGDVPIALSTEDGFISMVGNPYASPVSLYQFFMNNETVLNESGGLYFWRKRNNQMATSYAVLTTTSYVANDGGVESGDEGVYTSGGQQWEDYYENTDPAEWVILPGQGFFVRGNGNAGNLLFTNDMRRPAGSNQPFFRMDNNQPQLSRLWLNLYNDTNFSQASVAYTEGATTGIDFGKDAKRFASPNLSLYSIAGEDNFSIQTRPDFEPADEVAMGYTVTTTGTYTISLHRKDGVFEQGQQVYLKDAQLDIIHDFTEGMYSFASEAGTFNERFVVVYSNEALGSNNFVANANNVIVYNKDNALHVNAGNIAIKDITVYDLRGRVIYTAEGINAVGAVLNLQPQQQVLVIKIVTENGIVSKKVVH